MSEANNSLSLSLSVVVPCYNEESGIRLFYDEVVKVLRKIKANLDPNLTYEFIFVDDGSRDKTVAEVSRLISSLDDNSVRLIKFSRNFGKEAAILAGLENAKGKAVVLMDADLQHPPHMIEQMYKIWLSGGAKIIYTKCTDRSTESLIKAKFSELFYQISNILSDVKIESGMRDFRLMDSSVVKELVKMREYHRFSKMMFAWVGFERVCLEYDYEERAAGETSWKFWGLFKKALLASRQSPLKWRFG